jgi:hypothetical protein
MDIPGVHAVVASGGPARDVAASDEHAATNTEEAIHVQRAIQRMAATVTGYSDAVDQDCPIVYAGRATPIVARLRLIPL